MSSHLLRVVLATALIVNGCSRDRAPAEIGQGTGGSDLGTDLRDVPVRRRQAGGRLRRFRRPERAWLRPGRLLSQCLR